MGGQRPRGGEDFGGGASEAADTASGSAAAAAAEGSGQRGRRGLQTALRHSESQRPPPLRSRGPRVPLTGPRRGPLGRRRYEGVAVAELAAARLRESAAALWWRQLLLMRLLLCCAGPASSFFLARRCRRRSSHAPAPPHSTATSAAAGGDSRLPRHSRTAGGAAESAFRDMERGAHRPPGS